MQKVARAVWLKVAHAFLSFMGTLQFEFSCSLATQGREQLLAVWTSQAGASIPAFSSRVSDFGRTDFIVALDNIVKGTRSLGRTIEQGVHESYRFA